MADKSISDLTAASEPLDGTEKVLLTQGANSRRSTTEAINVMGAPIETQSGTSYTLVAADRGKWLRFTNSSAITCTIDNSVFSAGDEVIFEQAGSGVITFTAGAGVTLNSAGSLVDSNGQYSVQGIKFISASVAVLFGDLA